MSARLWLFAKFVSRGRLNNRYTCSVRAFLAPGSRRATTEVSNGLFANNRRDGRRVDGEVPADLGPCAAAVSSGRLLSEVPQVIAYPPDPYVHDSAIPDNGGVGIRVGGPHIPMQSEGNEIRGNKREGVAIAAGRAISAHQLDDICAGRYRMASEVDLPLAPETRIERNNIQDNGADVGELQIYSAHRLGVLPVVNNYWGTTDDNWIHARVYGPNAHCEYRPFATSAF